MKFIEDEIENIINKITQLDLEPDENNLQKKLKTKALLVSRLEGIKWVQNKLKAQKRQEEGFELSNKELTASVDSLNTRLNASNLEMRTMLKMLEEELLETIDSRTNTLLEMLEISEDSFMMVFNRKFGGEQDDCQRTH